MFVITVTFTFPNTKNISTTDAIPTDEVLASIPILGTANNNVNILQSLVEEQLLWKTRFSPLYPAKLL